MTKSQVSQSWHKPAGALMAWLDSVSVMTAKAAKAELSWVKPNRGNTTPNGEATQLGVNFDGFPIGCLITPD